VRGWVNRWKVRSLDVKKKAVPPEVEGAAPSVLGVEYGEILGAKVKS